MSSNNSKKLAGKVALVTGASKGIGAAIAKQLAADGASVVVNYSSSREGADRVVAEIGADGGKAVAVKANVAKQADIEQLLAETKKAYGKLDILVNNAGILRDRMVFSMTEDEWDSVIRVHLKGHFNTTHFASVHWRARAKASGGPVHGRIVNTSSEAFLAGSAGQPNYAAAKGGIVGLTTSTALALARYGVTANVICPRARTRMTEDVFAGFGQPEDGLDPLAPEHVAPLVGYLASPAAAHVNGQLLVVHGGMVAVVERPRVAAKFDSKQDTFSHDELDALLTPYYADRPSGETFAAAEVLGLRREDPPR